MAERARDWDDALDHARELLALDPLAEDAHRRLMRLHHLKGDRAAALLAFDACERILKDEVGTRPSRGTMELLAAVEASAAAGVPAPRSACLPPPCCIPPRLVVATPDARARRRLGNQARVLASRRGWARQVAPGRRLHGRVRRCPRHRGWRASERRPAAACVAVPAAARRCLRPARCRCHQAFGPNWRALLPELGASARGVDGTRLALAVETVLSSRRRTADWRR